MIKRARLYLDMLFKIALRRTVSSEDYMVGYDEASSTYGMWLERMGRFTDRIMDICPESKEETDVLDFACGTGYVSRNIEKIMPNASITSVDISCGMLEQLKKNCSGNVKTVNMGGIEFLESCSIEYDNVFFAWALPYFNHNKVLRLICGSIKKGGTLHIISNSRGTLRGIEKALVNVMEQNLGYVKKPMMTGLNLPDGKKGLSSWAESAGFEPVETGEDEAIFEFDSADELLKWLEMTGALAGLGAVFEDYDKVRPDIVSEIERTTCSGGACLINHRFAYGVFKKI